MRRIIMFLCLIIALPGYALTPVVLDAGFRNIELGRYIELFEDHSGKLTFDDISKPEMNKYWYQSRWDIPNFGYNASTFWVRFKINGTLVQNTDELYLILDYPLLDYIKIYLPGNNGDFFTQELGDRVPWKNRSIENRNPVFIIKPALLNNQIIYLKIRSEGDVVIPLLLMKPEYFYHKDHVEQLIFGAYFGIILIMIIYNFFIFLTVRDRNYLIYVLFLLALSLFSLSFTGLLFEHILSSYPDIANSLVLISSIIAVSVAIWFTVSFLETKSKIKIIHRTLLSFLLIKLIFVIISSALPYSIMAKVILIESIVSYAFLIIIGLKFYLDGYKIARFYVVGWMFTPIGTIIVSLKNLGILPSMFITEYAIFIANIFEISMLSFALADRINIIKQEKEEAQQETLRIQIDATANLEKKVEERTNELALANAKLSELDRIKSNFFANISHEIRTPLTLILTPIESFLYKENTVTPDKRFFESVYRNGLRLLGLINNLLDFSRLDAGRTELVMCEIDIIRLIKNHIDSVRSMNEVKGIELLFEYDIEHLVLNADLDKIDKIVANLFSNAIKFTDQGGRIKVYVNIESADNSEYCLIRISDTGIGIPEEHLEVIFDRFSQIDANSSRRYEGTGIGLALVKEYIKLHNGTISVISRHIDKHPESHGSIFTIRIPITHEHLTTSVDELSGNSGRKPYGRYMEMPEYGTDLIAQKTDYLFDKVYDDETKTILVVEDNPGMHTLLNDILAPQYRLIKACSGIEALSLLESEENLPDLILTDVMMPEMDGNELTHRVRMNPRFEGIPVILLTARAEMDMKLEGFDTGATDYIIKPFNSMELTARIRSQLELKVLRDNLIRTNKQLYTKLSQSRLTNDTVSFTSEKKIIEVKKFINENYTADISREGMASAVDMNPDNLSRVFNRITGKRIDAYINELRINRAKQELIETDKSIITIAMDSGFQNLRTFNRLFKDSEDITPKEFREKGRIVSVPN